MAKQPIPTKLQPTYAEIQFCCIFNDSRSALKENLCQRELKQANRKVKQNIPHRSSPPGFALLCGDTCGRGFIKINRLVESPGSREALAGSLLAGAGRDGV